MAWRRRGSREAPGIAHPPASCSRQRARGTVLAPSPHAIAPAAPRTSSHLLAESPRRGSDGRPIRTASPPRACTQIAKEDQQAIDGLAGPLRVANEQGLVPQWLVVRGFAIAGLEEKHARRVFVLCGVATQTTCSGSHAAGRWMAIQPRLRRRTASVCSWLQGFTTKSVPLASLQACVVAPIRVAAMMACISAVQG